MAQPQADEAGMLARAVVVQRARLVAAGGQRAQGGFVIGPMRAAFEHLLVEAGPGQRRRGDADVLGFAIVRGAGQRQGFVGQFEAIGSAALDQRQCLQQLDRRAREDRPIDVAERGEEAAIGIDDRHRTAVEGLDRVAAPGLDQHGIHALRSIIVSRRLLRSTL
jgi:hypothetical protein